MANSRLHGHSFLFKKCWKLFSPAPRLELLEGNEIIKEGRNEYYGPTENHCTVSNSGFPHPPLETNRVSTKDTWEIITSLLFKITKYNQIH